MDRINTRVACGGGVMVGVGEAVSVWMAVAVGIRVEVNAKGGKAVGGRLVAGVTPGN